MCTLTYTAVSFKATQGKRQDDCSLCTEVFVCVCVQDSESEVGQKELYSFSLLKLHNGGLLYNDSSETGNTLCLSLSAS